MAGGRGILDADGRLLIRSDGTADVCEDCCDTCPPASVQVTFSGVDAARCSGCIDYDGASSFTYDSLAVDGSYTVAFLTTLPGGSHRFRTTFSGSGYGSTTEYLASAACGGGGSSHSSDEFVVLVDISSDCSMVEQVDAEVSLAAGTSINTAMPAFSFNGSSVVGSSVANSQSCETPPVLTPNTPASSGGTATVTT